MGISTLKSRCLGGVGALPLGLSEGARTHFSKLKRGKRMLFLMKIVKFSASIMTGLWARTGGRRRGDKGAFTPGTTLPGGPLPTDMWSWPLTLGRRVRGRGRWQVR